MASDSHLSGTGYGQTKSDVYYKTMMCRYHMNNRCSRGGGCQFAHSPEDLRVAPDLTRTKMCAAIIRQGRCEVPHCRFAHSRSQLRTLSMQDSAGDTGNIPQSEHTSGMRHWDQPPAANLPPGAKELSVVGLGDNAFWNQPSGGRCSSQGECTDVQGAPLPVRSSPHRSADPFEALPDRQCAALLPLGTCGSDPAPFEGKTEGSRGEGRLIGNPLAEVARGPGPQSSYLQPPAAPGFTAGEIPLAGDGSPLIPALDHVSGDKKLGAQEEPKLAAMQAWQYVHACAEASQGLGSASCQDCDACEGSIQNIFLARLSV